MANEKPTTNTPPAKAPAVGLKGVTASATRKALHGPEGPARAKSSRDALCELLSLKDPPLEQLLSDAVAEIRKLRTAAAKR